MSAIAAGLRHADTNPADQLHGDLRYDDLRYDGAPAPAVLVFGDDALRARRLARLAEAAGARLIGEHPIADAAERIERHGGRVAAILIDAAQGGAPSREESALFALLGRIDAGVAAARFAAIVVTSQAMLDGVYAHIAEPGVEILVDPDDRQIEAALDYATRPIGAMLSESAGEAACRRLVELGDEYQDSLISTGAPNRGDRAT